MTKFPLFFALALAIVAPLCSAYEMETHAKLSEAAALQSVLGDQTALNRLGLRQPIDSQDTRQKFFGSSGGRASILDLIVAGSQYEDNIPPGPIYHFFDPRTNLPLHMNASDYPTAPPGSVATINAITRTSPDWVVLGEGSVPPFDANDYSIPKARNYLYQALTSPVKEERQSNFGLLFDSVGRMIHHIEDMAQPQHVRNDNHLSHELPDTVCTFTPDLALNYLCQTYRALRRESVYERWTNTNEVLRNLPITGYAPVYPGIGATLDGLGIFEMPRQFWINSGKGMAEYTNRNFLSSGTMNETPPLTYAGIDVDLRSLCLGAAPSCEVAAMGTDYVTFFPSFVDDQFRPSGGLTLHEYAAAESLFNAEFTSYSDQVLRTVNRFTFAKDHEFVIPRAVGYSAGLINYFFRGNMDIALPDEGIYAVVDQCPSGCGNPCAFRTLKLKLKNVTPGNGQFHEEPMGDDVGASNLWAVAKYHLNNCYQPDLSGEDGGSHFSGNSCRSTTEYVSVSAPRRAGIVGADKPQQYTFDFSANPIPINASDIFLQVVFRGRLGMEDDAVAVATKDISEPTYYGLENVTDYAYDENGDQKYHPVASDASMVDVTDVHIAFGPNADKVDPVASLALLAGGQHAQIAVLMDTGPQQASISLSGEFGQAPAVVQFDPAEFTQDDDGAAAGLYQRNCDLVLRRGLYRERGVLFVQRTHGIVGGIHILDNQTSSAAAAELPVTSERHGARAESVRDPRCTHLTTGMYDLSSMTPFVPEAAQSWTIRF